MPFECSKFFDESYKFYFSSIGLNKIFKSSFNSSILLTIIILFIIILYFPSKKNTPFNVMLKIGIYVFIVNYLTLFLHKCVNKNIENTPEEILYGGGGGDNNICPNLGGREIIGGDSYDTKIIGGADLIESLDGIGGSDEPYINEGTDEKIFSLYGV